MPPIRFGLGVNRRITVYLAGRGLKYLGLGALGQPQHIDGAMHAGFRRLHRVELVVDGRGRAGQIVYFVHFDIQRKGDVVAQQFKIGPAQKVLDVPFLAGEVIVHTKDIIALLNQPFAQVRSQESCPAGNQNAFSEVFHSIQSLL